MVPYIHNVKGVTFMAVKSINENGQIILDCIDDGLVEYIT